MKTWDNPQLFLDKDFGFTNPTVKKFVGVRTKMEEMQEAKPADVVKFEKEGDNIEGIYLGHEESKQYPKSYALKFCSKLGGVNKVVFVSAILIDLLKTNLINIEDSIKIVYQGKKKTADNTREYNDYKLFFKHKE